MPHQQSPGNLERVITPVEVADRMILSIKTLANWRYIGIGPAYCKTGGRVRYRRASVEAFIESNERKPPG